MRYRAALLGLVLLAAGCGGGGGKTTGAAPPSKPPAGKLKVVVKGLPARPKAGTAKWPYTVTATSSSGAKVSGKLTVQLVDPLGTAHSVTYANTKKPITNFPFHGSFHDYLQFPKSSVGFSLTVRAKVKSSSGSGTGTYGVKPK